MPLNTEKQTPPIDIIIVSFNANTLIERCINSISKIQSVSRVFISDNHSTDESLDQIEKLAATTPKVTLIKNKRNYGFSKGNNQALPYVKAPFLLFLNPDTDITESSVVKMLNTMQANPKAGMVGPLILNEDGSEQRGCRRREPTPILALKTLIGKREKGINQVGTPLPHQPTEVDAISGAFMLVRKEALDDVGPMDETYFLHCEDLDWCKRFRLKGWKVMFVPDATITHFKGGSSRKRPIRVEWHKHAGMVRYYSKFYRDKYPKPLMWTVYAAVWSRFFIMAPVWWVKGLFA